MPIANKLRKTNYAIGILNTQAVNMGNKHHVLYRIEFNPSKNFVQQQVDLKIGGVQCK